MLQGARELRELYIRKQWKYIIIICHLYRRYSKWPAMLWMDPGVYPVYWKACSILNFSIRRFQQSLLCSQRLLYFINENKNVVLHALYSRLAFTPGIVPFLNYFPCEGKNCFGRIVLQLLSLALGRFDCTHSRR